MKSNLQKIRNYLKYGLIGNFLLYRMRWIGILVVPHYLIQEGTEEVPLQELNGDSGGYSFDFFGEEEIRIIGVMPEQKGREPYFLSLLKKGKKCFGVKYHGEIVAFNWLDFDEIRYRKAKIPLNECEAYLFNMYTMTAYRGKNIAPHLRHHSYQALRDLGRDTFYSISDTFNAPAIKFKKKVNAKFLKLCLYVELFKKYHWNRDIKKYKTQN